MHVAQQPSRIHIAHDVFDGIEGELRIRRVMHRKHHTGENLKNQDDGKNPTERVPEVQIARRWVPDEMFLREPDERKPGVEPACGARFREIGRPFHG